MNPSPWCTLLLYIYISFQGLKLIKSLSQSQHVLINNCLTPAAGVNSWMTAVVNEFSKLGYSYCFYYFYIGSAQLLENPCYELLIGTAIEDILLSLQILTKLHIAE